MNKIKITIPDDLTPAQELLAIGKQLGRKMLPANQKLLGSGYEIKHLETQIIIVRKSIEKPIVTRCCSVCDSIFEQKVGSVMWSNYGGSQRKHYYCSNTCRDKVLAFIGNGRAAIKRSELKSIKMF